MKTKPTLLSNLITFCILALYGALCIEVQPVTVRAQASVTPTPTCTPTPSSTPSPTRPPLSCTCTPTPSASVTPVPGTVAIPEQFQKEGHGVLAWEAFTPTPAPSASPPGVVLVHGGGWNMESSFEIEGEAKDLATAGYYVVSVNYDLAPCGYIPGQPCHDQDDTTPGWWVGRQTDDVKAFVTALEASGQVDPNKIGIVGGSAGATLAAFIAMDTNYSGAFVWPYWTADARPVCAVLLSAPYDFSDRTPADGQSAMNPATVLAFENFSQTNIPDEQRSLSPVSLVSSDVPFVPLFMISSEFDDTVPHQQWVDMICALESNGVSTSAYKTLLLKGSGALFRLLAECRWPLQHWPLR